MKSFKNILQEIVMEHDENHTPVQLTIPPKHATVLGRWASTGRTLDRSRKLLGDHPHNEEIDNTKHTTNTLHKAVQEQLWKQGEKQDKGHISAGYGKVEYAHFKTPVNITAQIPNHYIEKLKSHKDNFYNRTAEHIESSPIDDKEDVEEDKMYNHDDLKEVGPAMDWLHSEVKKHI